MSDEATDNNKALGLIFIMLGISMTASLGIALNPAFVAVGLPFIMAGVYFLFRKEGEE
ncbi:MAG: hypothetical protein AAF291_04385 [Pseudomonadota bacterium]